MNTIKKVISLSLPLMILIVSLMVFLPPTQASAENECNIALNNPCCAFLYEIEDLPDRIKCTSGGSDDCSACCPEYEED